MIAIVVVLPIAILLARSATPILDINPPVASIGQATSITLHVRDARGVRKAEAFVEQAGTRFPVWQLAQPSAMADSTFSFVAGTKTTPQLRDGQAKLIVEATSNDLRRKTATLERDVTIVTQPPTVSVD